jgi:hypothetical protein
VLAIYPCQTGFGFAVVERTRRLLDWGEAELGRNTDDEFVARVGLEIGRCRPDALVVEDVRGTRRGLKAQRRGRAALSLAARLGVAAAIVSPQELRAALSLSPDATKHAVAGRLCDIYPELAPHAPRQSIWQKDPKMNLFCAVALATALAMAYLD